METDSTPTGERLRRLVQLAGDLSRAASVSEVAEAAVATGTAHLRADSVSVCLHDPARRVYDIVAAGGLREQDRVAWASFGDDLDVPVVDAVRQDRAIVIKDLDERRARYPALGQHRMVSETLVAAPMRVASQPIGALAVGFKDIRPLSADDLTFVEAVADLCGQALHRARLMEYQQQSLARQRFLADATHILAEDLDHEHTLARVARLTVGGTADAGMADACLVVLSDEDGALRTVAAAHGEPEQQAVLDQLVEHQPVVQNEQLLEAARTGEAIFMPVVDPDETVAAARDSEHLRLLQAFGVTSGIVVPLRARGRVLGLLLLLLTTEGRQLSLDDRAFAEDLASRSALAIDNARLATETRKLAENLKIALESRTVIEQAKGALAEHLDISPSEAFDRMRRAARSQRRKLEHLAEDILDGRHDTLERSAS